MTPTPLTRPRTRWQFVAVAALAGLVGCKSSYHLAYPVEGTVTLADGKALTHGTVEFRSEEPATEGLTARGEIRPDGTYKLTTRIDGKERVGAVAGRHRVIVRPPDPPEPAKSDHPAPLPPFAAAYQNYETSPLEFVVQPGQNSYPIVLER
jgi:hypothetical protein